jgi:MFS family permease
MDRVGRRLMLLIGVAGCVVCVAINAAMVALYTGTDNHAGLGVGVAALFVFLVFYAGFVDAPFLVFLGEIYPNNIRARGISIAIATTALTDILYLQITPFAFAAIGWKYFMVGSTSSYRH